RLDGKEVPAPARPQPGVEEHHIGRLDADHHLSGGRLGIGQLTRREHLRSTEICCLNCFHERLLASDAWTTPIVKPEAMFRSRPRWNQFFLPSPKRFLAGRLVAARCAARLALIRSFSRSTSA